MMESREQGAIEADLEKLARAECSEAFEFFKSILHKQAARHFATLMASGSMPIQEEHDLLTKTRAYAEMLGTMPGARWAIYDEWANMVARMEVTQESRFKKRNATMIRRYEDWKRQAGGFDAQKTPQVREQG